MAAQSFSVVFDGYWRESKIGSIPSHSGIYCVYECTHNTTSKTVTLRRLIYIGEAGNVNTRIAGHEKWPRWRRYVNQGNELCFSTALVDAMYRDRIEAAFIFKHKPPVNDEYVNSFPFDQTTISASGTTDLLHTQFTVYRTP